MCRLALSLSFPIAFSVPSHSFFSKLFTAISFFRFQTIAFHSAFFFVALAVLFLSRSLFIIISYKFSFCQEQRGKKEVRVPREWKSFKMNCFSLYVRVCLCACIYGRHVGIWFLTFWTYFILLCSLSRFCEHVSIVACHRNCSVAFMRWQ